MEKWCLRFLAIYIYFRFIVCVPRLQNESIWYRGCVWNIGWSKSISMAWVIKYWENKKQERDFSNQYRGPRTQSLADCWLLSDSFYCGYISGIMALGEFWICQINVLYLFSVVFVVVIQCEVGLSPLSCWLLSDSFIVGISVALQP